jgi:hypothetical protein
VPEVGAHAGPSADELHTFIVSPPDRSPSLPITHPRELYSHFVMYREG